MRGTCPWQSATAFVLCMHRTIGLWLPHLAAALAPEPHLGPLHPEFYHQGAPCGSWICANCGRIIS